METASYKRESAGEYAEAKRLHGSEDDQSDCSDELESENERERTANNLVKDENERNSAQLKALVNCGMMIRVELKIPDYHLPTFIYLPENATRNELDAYLVSLLCHRYGYVHNYRLTHQTGTTTESTVICVKDLVGKAGATLHINPVFSKLDWDAVFVLKAATAPSFDDTPWITGTGKYPCSTWLEEQKHATTKIVAPIILGPSFRRVRKPICDIMEDWADMDIAKKLIALADERHREEISRGNNTDDFKTSLSFKDLFSCVPHGYDIRFRSYALLETNGTRNDRIILSRCSATGKFVDWQKSCCRWTQRILLNAPPGFGGGDFVYIDGERAKTVESVPFLSISYGNNVIHGFTKLWSGVRYELALFSE